MRSARHEGRALVVELQSGGLHFDSTTAAHRQGDGGLSWHPLAARRFASVYGLTASTAAAVAEAAGYCARGGTDGSC